MSMNNADKLSEKFDKLSDKQKLEYYEAICGENLFMMWREWEDDLIKEQLEEFDEILKNNEEESFEIELNCEVYGSYKFKIYDKEAISFVKEHIEAGRKFDVFFPEYEW